MKPVISTVNELLHRYLTRFPKDQAVGYTVAGNGTAWLSTAELAERIRALSLGLRTLGVRPGDRVALLSENRWEWMVTDFAILAAGAVNVPIHPGLTPSQIGYILADSGTKVALSSTPELTGRLLEARREVPEVAVVVAFDDTGMEDPVLRPLQDLMQDGRAYGDQHPGQYRRTRDGVRPDDLASLIYTSGTTGDPKGVMLTHSNFASNVTACCTVFDFTDRDLALSFLPLCHVFERTVDYSYYNSGCRVVHIPDLTQVAAALTLHRPTVFAAVPRLYEKMYARIQEKVPASRRRLFQWAVSVGVKEFHRRQQGRTVGPWLGLQRALADFLVFRKIRQGLGGNVRFSISGGAPLGGDLAEFFLGTGLLVLEGYGLTETSPVTTLNPPERPRPGTVGPPIPGVEVRIAADGEVLTRGPHVMRGYWGADDKTAEVMDDEGWFYTGDVGKLDDAGYLLITDRKKEIIVTAQGKNVAPQPLENLLQSQPLVNQATLVGDRRPFLIALIVPDWEVVKRQAQELGVDGLSAAELVRHPALLEAMEKSIQQATVERAHHEQIRRFVLLEREFSQELGEVTPKLSLKRRVIEKNFAAEIDALYQDHARPQVVGS